MQYLVDANDIISPLATCSGCVINSNVEVNPCRPNVHVCVKKTCESHCWEQSCNPRSDPQYL